MKKVAFVVILIAVVVGMVFGGLSLASAAPKPKTDPLANVTKMETLSGIAAGILNLGSPKSTIVGQNYDSIRHFHVTCKTHTAYSGYLHIIGWINYQGGWVENYFAQFDTSGACVTDEFDASAILIEVSSNMGVDNAFDVEYAVTMTYPTPP